MSDCNKHPNHEHTHGPGCGHTAIMHDGHVDYTTVICTTRMATMSTSTCCPSAI